MISQRNRQKQNTPNPEPIKSGNMLYKAIQVLKQDKQNIVRQSEQRQKYHEQQKKKLRMQIQGYKKKVAQLTQANILNGLLKKQYVGGFVNGKVDSQLSTKIKKLELEVEHYRKIIQQKQKTIQANRKQSKQLQKRIKSLQEQKQKHLQISLIQKINLQEKIELFQRQLVSKKKIIQGLKLQIQRTNKLQFQLGKKERQIVKRGRQMNRYQEQFQSYFAQTQNKFKRKIQNLQQQNLFLRKQIKKIVKKVKNTCQCQGQMQQWKQKLYEVGKQLAKARVQLGRKDMAKDEPKKNIKQIVKKKYQSDQNDHENEGVNVNVNVKYQQNHDSIDSLTLSEESSQNDIQMQKQNERQILKKTQKKK